MGCSCFVSCLEDDEVGGGGAVVDDGKGIGTDWVRFASIVTRRFLDFFCGIVSLFVGFVLVRFVVVMVVVVDGCNVTM